MAGEFLFIGNGSCVVLACSNAGAGEFYTGYGSPQRYAFVQLHLGLEFKDGFRYASWGYMYTDSDISSVFKSLPTLMVML